MARTHSTGDPDDPSRRRPTAGQRPGFGQTDQSVGTQFNIAGDAVFHAPAWNDKTRSELPGRLVEVRKTRAEEVLAMERDFGAIDELAGEYVVPDLQDFNPPEEENDRALIVSRQPAFGVIDKFLARPGLTVSGNRVLFILGDAGMGKTSLLRMLKLRHLTSLRPPSHRCELMKLGPDTLERLAEIPNPARCILLLDSLDEDAEAHRGGMGADGRLRELLPRISRFHRCVLTCRTQFFPETSTRLLQKIGHFVFENFECPLKYLSLFDDAQSERYLQLRYGRRGFRRIVGWLTSGGAPDPRLAMAQEASRSMGSLRLRPLLLSWMDDLVGEDHPADLDFRNRYAVYHRLVNQWLVRDAGKPLGMSLEESWRTAILLALHLARIGQPQIHRERLAEIPGLEKIGGFKVESRSLLNRVEGGRFQFAHRTIHEFLLAHAVLHGTGEWDVRGITLSREAFRFLVDGRDFLQRESVDFAGAKPDFEGAALQWVWLRFGIEWAAITPGEFRMGSPRDEAGRSMDEIRHRVRLSQGYWLARHPVTQRQYQAVMGENPSKQHGRNLPVENVGWEEAVEFCRRLNRFVEDAGIDGSEVAFRLPTEAEWEYACRAGTDSAFHDGSPCTEPAGLDPALDRLGWFDKNSGSTTHPVGLKLPNAWGLHDLHGNVWEWCLDQADWKGWTKTDTYTDGVVDPLCESGAGRVVRGGSAWDTASDCRSAVRGADAPGIRDRVLGFRVAAGPRSVFPTPDSPPETPERPDPDTPADRDRTGKDESFREPP